MIREIIREELRSAPNELDNLPPPQGLEDRVWQRVEQNLAPIDKAPVFHSRWAVKNFQSGQQNAGEEDVATLDRQTGLLADLLIETCRKTRKHGL
ncbi:hypothetical protein LAZ67_8001131 [Cordylochernes scorpioides]|uniref:Uncharacterized protein n=1 Tax=Cordylochernes scorpioides TaxID=51811 RepID=A0ABY6KPY5_9ARAC|nr:hypothetical protein LAZ67_8001131 [Cordylochernes scorpioides]